MMPATVLVCDDDSAIRTVLNQALGRAGYDVRTTGTAAGLWRWISAGEGSLVITDVVLPDESGFDLTPRIKPYVQTAGIDIPDATLPAGDHLVRVDVKDSDGRAGTGVFVLKVAP